MGFGIGFGMGPFYYRQRLGGKNGCAGCLMVPFVLFWWMLVLCWWTVVLEVAVVVWLYLGLAWLAAIPIAAIVAAVKHRPAEQVIRYYTWKVGNVFSSFNGGVARMLGMRRR